MNQMNQKINSEVAQGKLIKIAKPDGSLQCNQGHKIPLEEMAKELAGIKIYNSWSKNDGMIRIQLCGSPTGQYNVYEVHQDNLTQALNLGFKSWKQD